MIGARVDWAQWKTFVAIIGSKYIERQLDDGNLLVEAWNGPVYRSVKLKSGTGDYTEYVNDYQSGQGRPFRDGLAQDDFQISTRCVHFTATKNIQTTHDKTLDDYLYLRGGCFYSPNSTMGDWLKIQVVHPNPEIGVLNEFVPEALVFPGIPTEISHDAISEVLSTGLIIRTIYNSHTNATEDAVCGVNFNTFTKI